MSRTKSSATRTRLVSLDLAESQEGRKFRRGKGHKCQIIIYLVSAYSNWILHLLRQTEFLMKIRVLLKFTIIEKMNSG